jgi:thioredoxin 1
MSGRCVTRYVAGLVAVLAISGMFSVVEGWAQSASSPETATFPALEQWKSAIIAGDVSALKQLYSTSPAVLVVTKKGQEDADADVGFWIGLKPRSMKLDVVQSMASDPGTNKFVVQVEIRSTGSSGEETVYVTAGQVWQQQGEQWRLIAIKRTGPAHLKQPVSTSKNIYPPEADARAEIKEAKEKAAKLHKQVLLVFGANWCYDCHVLDLAFQRPDLAPVLSGNYEVVHVDVGRGDKNQDLMQEYQVPMKGGIPGLAALGSEGKLLYSQKNGEFENARNLTPEALLEFLNKWKPKTP